MHSADKLAEMRTKFHVIQAKLIMSVWCFTVHWGHLVRPVQGAGGGGAVRGAGGGHAHQGAAEPRHQEQEAGQQGHQRAQAQVSLETAAMGQPSINPP